MRIAHIVSLESLAGVEILYKDFIHGSSNRCENFTISPSNRINTFIKDEIFQFTKIFFYKKLGFLHLPKINRIRSYHFQSIINKNQTNIVLNWNRLKTDINIPKSVKSIYYEHSAVWYNHCANSAEKILQRADGIIAVSHAAKRVLELKYGRNLEEKIFVTRNPLPFSRSSLLNSKPIKNRVTLGFIGRFMPVKAPWIILHTLKELREKGLEADAILVGDGPLLEEMKKLARFLGIDKYTQFTGSVSEPAPYYEKIKYLIIPSYCEPFGLVALEGIHLGCLPLYNDIDGVGESFRHFSDELSLIPVLGEKENIELRGDFPRDIPLVFDHRKDSLVSPMTPSPSQIVTKILALEASSGNFERINDALRSEILKEHQFSHYLEKQYHFFEKILHG